MLKEREQLTRNASRDAEAHDHYFCGGYHHVRSNLVDLKKPSNTLRRQRRSTPPTRWHTQARPILSSSFRFPGTLIRRMSVPPRRPLLREPFNWTPILQKHILDRVYGLNVRDIATLSNDCYRSRFS
jgi:hypothetical protein